MPTAMPIILDSEASLFDEVYPKDRFPFLSFITMGILHVQQIDLKSDRIYLVDSIEENEFFVYDRNSVGRAIKTLWKLKDFKITQNSEALAFPVLSTPKKFGITVEIKGVPCFDPDFGEKAGAWVKLDYTVRVQVSISSAKIGLLRESKDPLRTVQNRLSIAARSTLPYLPYQQALTGQIKEDLADWLRGYKEINATGLEVEVVEIEVVQGSEKVADAFQAGFNRIREAKDKSEIAGIFKEMEEDARNAYLEIGGVQDAGNIIAAKSRIASQALSAILAAGYSPIDAYKLSLQGIDKNKVIRATDPEDKPLQQIVAEKVWEKIDPKDWEPLSPPTKVTHHERLKWEKEVLKERIDPWVLEDPDEKLFAIKLKDDHMLKVRWEDQNSIPQAWINEKHQQDKFAILAPNAWNPEKRTVWDIFQAARRYLNV